MAGQTVNAAIALGSNVGDRRGYLRAAIEALRADPDISVESVSDWHETSPVGGPPGQGKYLNGAAELRTSLSARQLLERLQAIEAAQGRDRSGKRWGPRTLDLDLILFGDEEIEEPDLVVPHPRAKERIFVLKPLAQIAPERKLPGTDRTVQQRLRELWPL